MRRFLGMFNRRQFAASLLLAGVGRAFVQEPRKLAIRVKAESFGASETDIKAMLRSAADEIWRHCPNSRFEQRGFEVYRNEKHPITHFERSDDGWIVIGLATNETYWSQYAYQFAHEFCHALADHANDWRRAWHNVGHANKWLEESLCETASLFALRAMGKRWETEPPFGNWKSYAPKLTEYTQKRLDDPKVQLPEKKASSNGSAKTNPK